MWNVCAASLVVCFFGATTYGQADIRLPPSITQGPSKQSFIFRGGDSVSLDCKGKGVPAVVYEWKKNGLELNPNQPNIEKGVDGSITIRNTAASDGGFYQCSARNQYGAAVSNTAHIQGALLDSGSGSQIVVEKTIEEGLPFHIQAEPRKSFPKPAYGWEMAIDTVDKNPVLLRPSRRIQIAENGDLHFAFAQPEDAVDGRIYKCTTYNPQLDIKAGGSYTKLTMTRKVSRQFAPSLGFASETQTTAVIGGNVTLRCFFYGNPEPTIQWTGPKNTLPVGRYALNNFNSELVINNITATDQGDYTCAGSNIEGRNTSTFQIRVEAVPNFLAVNDGPRDVNVTEGESFTFNCNADAIPNATIVWFQDGQPLDRTQLPPRFAIGKDNRSLTIRDVCRDCGDRPGKQTDLTVIQCNASNVHGYAFASGYLNVLSRTTVTIHNKTDVEVYTDEDSRVQLDCVATSDPSTPPTFKWFKVEAEYDRPLHNEPPFVTVNTGLLTIHLPANASEIWSKYLGQYRCVVDTGHSRVNQTQYIYARLRPEAVTAAALKASMCGVFLDFEVCWFWVSIAAAVLGLFIIIVFICCAICQRNKEEKYNVDENERWTGRDPVKEFLDDGFQEYQRPEECITPNTLLSSRPSFGSTTLLGIREYDREEDSLNEYMGDEARFTEEGSFIGGTYRSQSRPQYNMGR